MAEKLERLFICITFNDEVTKEVARIQELLGKKIFVGKMTELENLHLTLKFLGEINGEKKEFVKKKLNDVKFNNFECKMDALGIFHINKNPRVAWVKLAGVGIWALQKKIDDALKEMFKPEERFMSHMAVSRIKYVKDKVGFEEHIKSIHAKAIRFKIDKFKLMKSDLMSSGPVYTLLEEYSAKES
jgi:RNA 2',3'-cyclic 3'-phosphodiesterase